MIKVNKTGKYLYCFIKEKTRVDFGVSAVSDALQPVYTIPYKDISAVVSDTDVFEYNPTRKKVMAHQKVVKRVVESYNIIPVAFGTVSNNDKEIERMISQSYGLLSEQLEYFKDKIELGLTVTWINDGYNEDIENEEIRVLKKKVNGKDENEVLPDKIQLGRLVEQATVSRREEYTRLIFEPLSEMSVESKLKEEVPIKSVFCAYFLIKKSDSDSFDEKVERLCKPYEDKLAFNYTGPWPPYNFIDIKLKI